MVQCINIIPANDSDADEHVPEDFSPKQGSKRVSLVPEASALTTHHHLNTRQQDEIRKPRVRHNDLVNPYNVAVSRIVSDVFANDAP